MQVGLAQTTVKVPSTPVVASPGLAKPLPPSGYELLVVKYLNNIRQFTQQKQEEKVKNYKSETLLLQKQSADLDSREAQLLADLRAQSQNRTNGKLDFREGSLERTLLSPLSPSAARMINSLYAEGRIETAPLYALFEKAELLVPEWASVFNNILSSAKSDDRERNIATKILYKMKVEREKYRPHLVKLALDGDADAIEELFFDVDPQNGLGKTIVSFENQRLLSSVTDRKFQSAKCYAVRLIAAKYALSQRNYNLSIQFCEEILSIPYVGMGKPATETYMEDFPVLDAKDRALGFLFYEVGNARSLQLVYDRSRIVEDQMAKHDAVLDNGFDDLVNPKTPWLRYDSYAIARLEIQNAQAMIAAAKDWSLLND